jgi:NADPH2:quinone reductase
VVAENAAGGRRTAAEPSVGRTVQITRTGGPDVVDDVPEPEARPGTTLHDVSATGVHYADTHHVPSDESATGLRPL